MFDKDHNSLVLEGPGGTLELHHDDEACLKLTMLFEGACTALGPLAAAAKYGYTKQRFYQLREKLRTSKIQFQERVRSHIQFGDEEETGVRGEIRPHRSDMISDFLVLGARKSDIISDLLLGTRENQISHPTAWNVPLRS